MWPGFKFHVLKFDGIPMLNLDIDYLAVKLETVLDLINEIKKEADPKSSDFRV